MAFNIIGTSLNKKNNVTLLAKKEMEVWCYDFAFGFDGRLSLVFIKGRQYHEDCMQQLETELPLYGSDYRGENKTGLLIISLKELKNGFLTIVFKFCTS